MSQLPSIDTLRALEAAVRLTSYSAAAREMNLTHGAISQRIRALESNIGMTLFVRRGNSMQPTTEARRLAEQARLALEILATAFKKKQQLQLTGNMRPPLVLSVVPALATLFLSSRLQDFHDLYPDIRVSLRPSPELVSLEHGHMDCALRYGRGPWMGTDGVVLPEHKLVAVASPDYADKHDLMRAGITELSHDVTLLHHNWRPWAPWLESVGVSHHNKPGGSIFDESDLLLRAAAKGDGLALVVEPFIRNYVASGDLVELPFTPIVDHNRFHILWAEGSKPKGVDDFSEWIARELSSP